ncbi:MAG: CFI-box-CTERM domain-containing protein, partial [Nitrosarchaeum sp.]|nr:CFI-box-CTERM domain-containing protein [Nitrosarchaeum sp.]
NEPTYKKWFDENYPEYSSIYQAVGLEEPKEIASFVDPTLDPQFYIDRYNNEPQFREWFDENYPDMTIYDAIGLEKPEIKEQEIGQCGPGTILVDGVCTPDESIQEGGGCLIATATFGSEMAPQVQLLREIRDNKVMNTGTGASFMTGFNQLYYSFSPTIADMERDNPAFKELVKLGITPMISSLSIMSAAESEQEIIGYGIGVILMNVGMYFVAPTMLFYGIKKAKTRLRD